MWILSLPAAVLIALVAAVSASPTLANTNTNANANTHATAAITEAVAGSNTNYAPIWNAQARDCILSPTCQLASYTYSTCLTNGSPINPPSRCLCSDPDWYPSMDNCLQCIETSLNPNFLGDVSTPFSVMAGKSNYTDGGMCKGEELEEDLADLKKEAGSLGKEYGFPVLLPELSLFAGFSLRDFGSREK